MKQPNPGAPPGRLCRTASAAPLRGLRAAAPSLPAQAWTDRRSTDSGDAAACKAREAARGCFISQCNECMGSTMGNAYSRPTRARAPRYAFFRRSESSSMCTSPSASQGTAMPRPGWNNDAKSPFAERPPLNHWNPHRLQRASYAFSRSVKAHLNFRRASSNLKGRKWHRTRVFLPLSHIRRRAVRLFLIEGRPLATNRAYAIGFGGPVLATELSHSCATRD